MHKQPNQFTSEGGPLPPRPGSKDAALSEGGNTHTELGQKLIKETSQEVPNTAALSKPAAKGAPSLKLTGSLPRRRKPQTSDVEEDRNNIVELQWASVVQGRNHKKKLRLSEHAVLLSPVEGNPSPLAQARGRRTTGHHVKRWAESTLETDDQTHHKRRQAQDHNAITHPP